VKDGGQFVKKFNLTMSEARTFMAALLRVILVLNTDMANPALIEQETFRGICRSKENICAVITKTRGHKDPSILLINHWSWNKEDTTYDEYVTPIFIPMKYSNAFMGRMSELMKPDSD
jgi:hypothetical protein